jgi:mono/diheme cytochrome c family protein
VDEVDVSSLEDDPASPPGPHREAPVALVKPRAHGVGHLVPDVRIELLGGETTSLDALCADGPLVVVSRDAECPLCRKFGPRLGRLEAQYAERGVGFLYLGVQENDSDDELRASQEAFDMHAPVTRGGALMEVLAPTTTTEVFVLDAARTLRYRGAVDDQYGIGYTADAPQANHLVDALEALLAGRAVATRATTSPGCALATAAPTADARAPTYHADISRIVQDHCLGCHRDGGVGPFALDDYESMEGRDSMIRYVLDNGIMPPWHAESGGPWANDRQLSERDREQVLAWVEAGSPEGDPAEAPLPLAFTDDWLIGEPDYVVSNPEAHLVPAEGRVEYQYAYVKTDFDEDRWISAIEVQPGAPQVVHHILVFLEEPRRSGESGRDHNGRFQSGLFGYFAAYVPGQAPMVYPEDHAKKLPAGAWLKFQVHYTPNGEEVLDESRIGFHFADGPPEVEVATSAVSTTKLRIPPGDDDYRVRAGIRFDEGATIAAFSPHMHLRGKAFKYELHYPDETRETVLDIPRYDFNWQTMYQLSEPITVPPGTLLVCTAWYDNSADNPANPDPEREVSFGEQTWDEMMIGYFEWWPSQS